MKAYSLRVLVCNYLSLVTGPTLVSALAPANAWAICLQTQESVKSSLKLRLCALIQEKPTRFPVPIAHGIDAACQDSFWVHEEVDPRGRG